MHEVVGRVYLPTASTHGTDAMPTSRQPLPTASTSGMDTMRTPRETIPTVATYGMGILHTSQAPLAETAPPPVETAEKPKRKKHHRPRAEKMTMQQAHYELVLEAAQAVTTIFHKHGLSCAVFGSLAAKLYGSSRCPKDVDMLISQELTSSNSNSHPTHKHLLTASELKDLVLRADSQHFYLKLPRDPSAEYRILWYRQHYRGPECKVDILVPGTMNLPRLPRHRVVFFSPRTEVEGEDKTDKADRITIPVVPFALLLAHKLQGWDDHRLAEEPYQQRKQHQDAGDVRRLLGLRREVRMLVEARAAGRSVWTDEELFDEDFQILTKGRVKAYCEAFPDRTEEWRKLGFETN